MPDGPVFELDKAVYQLRDARKNCTDPDRYFTREADCALLNRLVALIREHYPDRADEAINWSGLPAAWKPGAPEFSGQLMPDTVFGEEPISAGKICSSSEPYDEER